MRSPKAITLVELLIAVLILGALSAIAIPRLAASANNAKKRACAANVERINTQIELYKHNTGSWPSALTAVTENVSYFGGDEVLCPFGLPYILNTSIHRVSHHDHGGTSFAPINGGDDDGEQGQGGNKGNQGDNGHHGEGDSGNHYGWENGDNGNHGEGDNGNHYGHENRGDGNEGDDESYEGGGSD